MTNEERAQAAVSLPTFDEQMDAVAVLFREDYRAFCNLPAINRWIDANAQRICVLYDGPSPHVTVTRFHSMSDAAWVIIVFFNEERTDYIVLGPFANKAKADRAFKLAEKTYKAAEAIEQLQCLKQV